MSKSSISNNPSKPHSNATRHDSADSKELTMPKRGFVSNYLMPLSTAMALAVGGIHYADRLETPPKPEPATPAEPAKPLVTQALQHSAIYRVQTGDNVSKIAARFKISPNDLIAANPEVPPSELKVGQPLLIPGIRQHHHIVRTGDTFKKIAGGFKITERELRANNPTMNPTRLKVGQVIYLPILRVDGTRVSTVAAASSAPAASLAKKGLVDAWQLIPVDPKFLESRYVTPMPTNPPAKFYASVVRSLKFEAGKSRDVNDLAHQGGVTLTNYGITGESLADYIKHTEKRNAKAPELTRRIEALTYEEVLDIYACRYWQKGYQNVGKKVSFLLLDWGIIGGPISTLKRAQKALDVPQTGKIDTATVKAMTTLGETATCKKITEARIAHHRSHVAYTLRAINDYDERKREGTLKKGEKRPVDQSCHLKGWVDRVHAAGRYVDSPEFHRLIAVFERTAPQGCDLLDPIREGAIVLKKHSDEPTLIRMLQQRLTAVGYPVFEDGTFGPEMEHAVNFFQAHYQLAKQPSWGPQETKILDALLLAKKERGMSPLLGLIMPGR